MLKRFFFLLNILKVKILLFFSREKAPHHLIIVKIDAIGDYVIFRNFLEAIAKSSLYQSYKITLVGNILLKDLVNELDSDLIDHFIAIDHNPLKKDWIKLANEIGTQRYDTLINFHHSRTPTTELISFIASAKEKITMYGDTLRIKPWERSLFNRMYSRIVEVPSYFKAEFEFNKFFTENIIDKKLQLNAPFMRVDFGVGLSFIPDTNFIIVAPGAGVANRQPNLTHIQKVVNFLLQKNYTLCFIGSGADLVLINNILEKVPSPQLNQVLNLAGKTALNELPHLINKSLGVICNDSGVYHMSIALNKPTMCFAGGGHFERFVSYVKRNNIKVCYEPMPCFNCNWKCIYKFDITKPYPCIDSIDINLIYDNITVLEKEWLLNNTNTVDR